MKKEEITLSVLREEWKDILSRVQDQLIKLPENKANEHSYYIEDIEAEGLKDDFNDLIDRTNKIFKSFKIEEEVLPTSVYFFSLYNRGLGKSYILRGELTIALQRMEKECKKALKAIEGLIFSIPPTKEEELKSLRKVINENIEPQLLLHSQDLNRAIDNFEKGNFLESVLIAGRVINVALSKLNAKIPKEIKEKRREKDLSEEEKKKEWRSEIEKILKSKFKEEGILNALKLYREKFSHQVGIYPSLEESLMIISGTVYLIKKIIEQNLHKEI